MILDQKKRIKNKVLFESCVIILNNVKHIVELE